MESKEFLQLIKQRKRAITAVAVLFILLSLALSVAQPLKYGATSRLLVVQNFNIGADPYAVSRSNQLLSNVLVQVASSDSFYNEVVNSGYNIDKTYFSNTDPQKELAKWQKTVSVKSLSDSGIVEVNIYHPDKYQLDQIAQAVNYIYQTKHQEYDGSGDAITIKVIDKPLVSRWPVKPNLPLNMALGLIFGLLCGGVYVYLYPEKSIVNYELSTFAETMADKPIKNYSDMAPANYYASENEPVETPEVYDQPMAEDIAEESEDIAEPYSETEEVEEVSSDPVYVPNNAVMEPVLVENEETEEYENENSEAVYDNYNNNEEVEIYNADEAESDDEVRFSLKGDMRNILE